MPQGNVFRHSVYRITQVVLNLPGYCDCTLITGAENIYLYAALTIVALLQIALFEAVCYRCQIRQCDPAAITVFNNDNVGEVSRALPLAFSSN